jgi:hypothetical protein
MSQHQVNVVNSTAAAREARFALRVTAVLDDGTRGLSKDISTRLRFAREKALEHAHASTQPLLLGRGAGALIGGSAGWSGKPWLLRLASLLPLVALVGGLTLIQHLHQRSQISAAADIDAALLADEVPPAAYSDPGFVEFLKLPRD